MAEKKPEPASQPTQAPTQQQPAPKPLKPRTMIGDRKIVATRAPRQGDDGYQLNTIDDQVTVIFEDGSEKVVKSSDLFEPS